MNILLSELQQFYKAYLDKETGSSIQAPIVTKIAWNKLMQVAQDYVPRGNSEEYEALEASYESKLATAMAENRLLEACNQDNLDRIAKMEDASEQLRESWKKNASLDRAASHLIAALHNLDNAHNQ